MCFSGSEAPPTQEADFHQVYKLVIFLLQHRCVLFLLSFLLMTHHNIPGLKNNDINIIIIFNKPLCINTLLHIINDHYILHAIITCIINIHY